MLLYYPRFKKIPSIYLKKSPFNMRTVIYSTKLSTCWCLFVHWFIYSPFKFQCIIFSISWISELQRISPSARTAFDKRKLLWFLLIARIRNKTLAANLTCNQCSKQKNMKNEQQYSEWWTDWIDSSIRSFEGNSERISRCLSLRTD